MRRVCAWCDKVMGFKEGPDVDTHGICPECAEQFMSSELPDMNEIPACA